MRFIKNLELEIYKNIQKKSIYIYNYIILEIGRKRKTRF